MSNILDTIIVAKRKQVAAEKSSAAIAALEKQIYFTRETISLHSALLAEKSTGIIAEFKRRSPSKGIINDKARVEEVTAAYTLHGAAGLSVLTDAAFFGGSNNDLIAARVNETPILRKDFIIDEYQLIEAKAIGADVVLLIAACLSQLEVRTLAAVAKNLGLEVLLELHAESELEHICADTELVGINNRNLQTFEVDIERSLRMAERIPAEKIKVAESGIDSVAQIDMFRKYGYKGFLIGESFMKASDPGRAFGEFVRGFSKD